MSDQSAKTSGFGVGEAGKAPASTPIDDFQAALKQPVANQRMVKCDCGHTVPARLVMSASMGTSCPNCYDDMSD